jgi:hypothetical protein
VTSLRQPSVLVLIACATLAATVAVRGADPSNDASSFPDIGDHFKYGSVGTEERVGVPYWIWRVLPVVFEDQLPRRPGTGYERIGFLSGGAPHGRPIGTSYRKDWVALVGLNCATCHVGTIRDAPGAVPRTVLGMPANQMDLQAYARFLTAAAKDPRFTADVLLDAIEKAGGNFSVLDRIGYRLFIVGRVRRAILDRERENAWFDDGRPPFGAGRVDTFNPYKIMFGLPVGRAVGTVDLPSLWNQRIRQGLWLHWDGNNDLVEERNKSAAIGAGATPKSLDLPSLDRVARWTLDLKPPAYPDARIDHTRLAEGRQVYEAECAACHDAKGARVGQVTPLAEIGTDPGRVESFTADLAQRMNTIGESYPWKFSHFRKTEGYANMPLDGTWLRAPYLHNGSVPHLRALLTPEERPVTFYRAYDVYDWLNVGFTSTGSGAEREGVLFDTRLPGNGNRGHDYGATLTPAQKDALVEYLKTL